MIDDDTERRLLEMARWYHTREAGGHIAFTGIYDQVLPGGGYREASVPMMVGEAMETHDACERLQIDYRRAIYAHYLREGPKGEKLRDLNQDQIAERYMGVSRSTYQRRLEEGRVMVRIEIRLMTEQANRPYRDVA